MASHLLLGFRGEVSYIEQILTTLSLINILLGVCTPFTSLSLKVEMLLFSACKAVSSVICVRGFLWAEYCELLSTVHKRLLFCLVVLQSLAEGYYIVFTD